MTLTLRQIDAFRAIMEAGTLTEAAAHLRVSQPAISRLLADMESELGYQLFDRIGRRVTPTAEAEILVAEVKRALVGMEQIKEAAMEIGRFRYARLRLVTTPAVPNSLIVGLVQAFAQQHPDAFVSVEIKPPEMVGEYLTTHQCDLAVLPGAPDIGSFCQQKIASLPLCCLLPREHRFAGRENLNAEDLEGEVFISLRPGSILRARVDAFFESQGVLRTMRYEARTPDLARDMVCAGLGISLLWPANSAASVNGSGVVEVSMSSAPQIDLYLTWPRQRQLPLMGEAFIQIAQNCLKVA